jgi:endonuclease/exonuclease/phosphatase (EEP) superfamily protein YafD
MLLAALVLGGLALYYFGLRAGAWVAAATLVLCIIALVAPNWSTPIYAFFAAGAFALWRIGSRRQRPPDAVIAVRLVRRAIGRAWATARTLLGGGRDDQR